MLLDIPEMQSSVFQVDVAVSFRLPSKDPFIKASHIEFEHRHKQHSPEIIAESLNEAAK